MGNYDIESNKLLTSVSTARFIVFRILSEVCPILTTFSVKLSIYVTSMLKTIVRLLKQELECANSLIYARPIKL